MNDLVENVESLEKRLDDLGNVFNLILQGTVGQTEGSVCPTQNQCDSRPITARGGRPVWVEDIFRCFNKISGELRSVRRTLSAHTFTNGYPQTGDQPQATSTILESGQRELAATDDEPQASPSTATSLDKNITAQDLDETAPTFRCRYQDIGENLNEADFEKFSSDPRVKEKGYFKLVVEALPPLIMKDASQPSKDHCTNFSCQRESRGFVKLTREPNQEIVFPSFPLPESQRRPLTQENLKELWESALMDPPRDICYVIGDPLFPDIKLHPGKRLQRIGGNKLHGIRTTYAYLGFGETYSVMHGEDAKFYSVNLLRSGADKAWLVIQPAYEKELERRLRQEFPKMANCSQAIRHLSRLIIPSKLDEWGIPYSLDYCKPGEAIVTQPGALHQVRNIGTNYAIAINILYSSSLAIPKDYIFCQKRCDPHAITAADLRVLMEGLPAKVQAKPQKSTVIRPNITGTKRKALPGESQSRKPKVTPQIGRLFETVSGKEAACHLCSLIRSWREQAKPLFQTSKGGTRAVQLVQVISVLEKRSHLTEFLDRFAKIKLAEIIDKGKNRTSADPTAITNLINDLQWETTNKNRTKLHNYLKEGRQWNRVCSGFDGLLCLIPPNREDKENPQISGRVYYELSPDDIHIFHSLLNSDRLIKPMCRIGNIFQTSIWESVEVPKFKWESQDFQTFAHLPKDRLAPLMETLN